MHRPDLVMAHPTLRCHVMAGVAGTVTGVTFVKPWARVLNMTIAANTVATSTTGGTATLAIRYEGRARPD